MSEEAAPVVEEVKVPAFTEVAGTDKDELITSLAAIVCHDAAVEANADNLNAAITASGCSVEAYWPTLFGGILTKAGVDMDAFFPQPGSGGGGGGGGAAAATEAVVEVEKEKEESEDMGGGGMGMFGDEDGGDGAY